MKFTTTAWPVPVGHPGCQKSLNENLQLVTEIQLSNNSGIMKAVLLKKTSVKFLIVQSIYKLSIFKLGSSSSSLQGEMSKEINFMKPINLIEIRLVTGLNQTCFGVTSTNQIIKFYISQRDENQILSTFIVSE